MSEDLKISIVTPSLNQGESIERTIRSVLEQDYSNFEHIIVDGGSSDGTLDVLQRYRHLRWTSGPDRGQTDALNQGLRRATGEIFAYLNADDVYRPGAFAAVAAEFAEAGCDALAGDCDVIDETDQCIGRYRAQLDRPEDLLRYWKWNRGVCLPQPGVFVRKSVLEQAGGFDESFDMAMDLELWLRLARRTPIRVLHRALAAYRAGPRTKSRLRQADMVLESYRAARKHLALAAPERRRAIQAELRRETAGHLLTLAEQEGDPRRARRRAWQALKLSPLLLGSRRLWRRLGAPSPMLRSSR